jgi:hypothetical protein
MNDCVSVCQEIVKTVRQSLTLMASCQWVPEMRSVFRNPISNPIILPAAKLPLFTSTDIIVRTHLFMQTPQLLL